VTTEEAVYARMVTSAGREIGVAGRRLDSDRTELFTRAVRAMPDTESGALELAEIGINSRDELGVMARQLAEMGTRLTESHAELQSKVELVRPFSSD